MKNPVSIVIGVVLVLTGMGLVFPGLAQMRQPGGAQGLAMVLPFVGLLLAVVGGRLLLVGARKA